MVAVESRIEQVTVYARGARVRRVASVRAPGDGVVRLVGLPLALVDDSVRVEVDGGAIVTAVRAGLDVAGGAEPATEETPELRAARRRLVLATTEAERVTRALEQLSAAPIIADDRKEVPPAAWGAIVSARRALVELRAARERGLYDQLAAARRELEDAQRTYEVAAERDARAGTARAAKLHEPRKHVELDITARGDGAAVLRLEYLVSAARWAPSYIARLDGATAACELRAVVVQCTGEDWNGVALRLSTAEPDRFAELPELHPQKIGRKQPEPARRGFRAPPAGAAELYADYERAFPRPAFAQTFGAASVLDDSTFEGLAPTAPPMADLATEVWDDEDSIPMDRSRARRSEPMAARAPSRSAPPAGAAMAMPPPAMALAGPMQAAMPKSAGYLGRGGGGAPPAEESTDDHAELSAPAPPRLDYGNLVMAPASATDRGRLVAARRPAWDELGPRVGAGIAIVEHLALPPGCTNEWSHAYDYAFAGDGMVDVRADAAWHSLALTSRTAAVALRHVAVPREQPDVFRLATLMNPFEGPLLPGPIDVYDRGQFLVTAHVEMTPPAAQVELGLGVDPQVKIARNVEFREEAAGMLRGTLKLVHAITIEVENLSPRPVDLEVRERVPVVREGDDEVEVAIGRVEPAWERFTPDPDAPADDRLRGGYRWRVPVATASKQLLRAGYEVKISGKHELVGGNRREP
ncbi:MAG TPA: mucoidy inhibitor MuiA family protein [Kofleriaceae bacterium]|jgi:hypothetical protein